MRSLSEEFQKTFGDENCGVRSLKERCVQLELDNREMSRHIKLLLETKNEEDRVELYKGKILVFEQKMQTMA